MLQKPSKQYYYNSGYYTSYYTRWPLTNESSQWQQQRHQWPYKSHNVRSPRNQSHFCVEQIFCQKIESHESYQSCFPNSCTIHSTVFENHPKCLISIVQLWHFSPIFVLLKLTCLVTLYDRKLQVFKNSPKRTIFGIFDQLLPT